MGNRTQEEMSIRRMFRLLDGRESIATVLDDMGKGHLDALPDRIKSALHTYAYHELMLWKAILQELERIHGIESD